MNNKQQLDMLLSQTAYPAGFETLTPDWPPVSLFIPQMWCKCMNNMNILSYIKEVIHFKWKSKFDHYDPKWPQVDIWPHNIGTGSQTDEHEWVLWSCYVTWMSYSIFSANDLLTPVTPNDPRLIFVPIKSQEGLKLINMYKSYGHAV